MHRNIEIAVPPEATEPLVDALKDMDGVVAITVQRGEAVMPPGDVIGVTALNTAADDVLRASTSAERHGAIVISTSTVDSVIATENAERVRGDHDEASWEEAETAMRRHTRPNLNLLLTSAAGGVVAATALVATSGATEATALVAAAIITPLFEPLARIGLGLVNRYPRVVAGGLVSLLSGYLCALAAVILTMLLLRAAGHGYVTSFAASPTAHEVQHPPLLNLLLSAAGAVAGAVMVSAGRFTLLAGPVIAVQLMPAIGTIGIALELGDGSVAARATGRLGIDIGMVILACLIVFTYKHLSIHQRREARH